MDLLSLRAKILSVEPEILSIQLYLLSNWNEILSFRPKSLPHRKML